MPFKAKPGMAPGNVGVYRESWQSGHIKTMVMPCHRYYDHKQEWEETKDTVHIIAHAGENMTVHETYEEPRETQTSSISGRSLPVVKHHDVVRPVSRFERPAMMEPNRMKAVNVRAQIATTMTERAHRELMSGHKEPDTVLKIATEEKPDEKPTPSRPSR